MIKIYVLPHSTGPAGPWPMGKGWHICFGNWGVGSMKAHELENNFDEGKEEISKNLDISKEKKSHQEQKRVNVDFPLWMIPLLDKEA